MALPGFGARRGTKLRETILTVTQKYYEILAVKSDKAIDLYTVLLDRQPHEVECQSLCGSEVTWKKNKQFEVEGDTMPQYPIAGDANAHEYIKG